MKKPDQAISIIKDFCPGSGIEVEGYLNYLENKLYKIAEICKPEIEDDGIFREETFYNLTPECREQIYTLAKENNK
jgi:hypothetical protein